MKKILALIFLQMAFSGFLFAQGLDIGNPVRFQYKNKEIVDQGVVNKLASNFVIVDLSGRKVNITLKEIKRISNTGSKKKIIPIWSSTETNYLIFEFEKLNGYKFSAAFEMYVGWEVAGENIKATIWPDELNFIEVGNNTPVSFSSSSGNIAEGSRVLIKLKLESTAKQAKIIRASKSFHCMNLDGNRLDVQLTDIRSIVSLNRTKNMTPYGTYATMDYPLFEIEKINGTKITVAFYMLITYDFLVDNEGTRINIAIDQLDFIKAQ